MQIQFKDSFGAPIDEGDWVRVQGTRGGYRGQAPLTFVLQLTVKNGLIYPIFGFSFDILQKIEDEGFDPANNPKEFVKATTEESRGKEAVTYYREKAPKEILGAYTEAQREKLQSAITEYRLTMLRFEDIWRNFVLTSND